MMSDMNFRDHVYVAVLPVLVLDGDLPFTIDGNTRLSDVRLFAGAIADAVAQARASGFFDEDA